MANSKPSSYLDLKDQSNRDIREVMSLNSKTPAPAPRARLDNPKRRMKSVIHRVPQGSQTHKENQPPSASKASPYRPTINSNTSQKSQDIRERPDYRPTSSSKWPTLYGTRDNKPNRPSNSTLPRKFKSNFFIKYFIFS